VRTLLALNLPSTNIKDTIARSIIFRQTQASSFGYIFRVSDERTVFTCNVIKGQQGPLLEQSPKIVAVCDPVWVLAHKKVIKDMPRKSIGESKDLIFNPRSSFGHTFGCPTNGGPYRYLQWGLEQNSSGRISLPFSHGSRTAILVRAGIAIVVIAAIDWRFDVNISFGFLYLFPMLMVGSCLNQWQIAAVAALCTGLGEAFDPFPWAAPVGIPRLILTFAAFFGAGLFVFESTRNRLLASQHLRDVERQASLRREAEEQLEYLIESSPATIFTLDADGKILLANEAAHRLLGVARGQLQGKPIRIYIPALTSVLPLTGDAPFFRTVVECRGRRADGDVFLARVWFSTYQTVSGPRLAAVVLDASEELRDREEFSLQQLLSGSKILVGAVCHEIRNICGAVAAVSAKLAKNESVASNEDFRALRTLVEGLGRMAGLELRQTAKPRADRIDLRASLEELRIVIESSFRDSGISIEWDFPESVPPVWAEPQALLQAFLNITKNSQRAMELVEQRELIVRASADNRSVVVRFIDSGRGVAHPENLFQPFQPGAEATGLGLYLSRAFLRAFEGDLVYEPRTEGCCFTVVLMQATEQAAAS
jgi:two-component system sensor kinase FixL